MAKQEKEIERWVTVNGVRVPIFKDGSVGGPKALQDKIKKNDSFLKKHSDDRPATSLKIREMITNKKTGDTVEINGTKYTKTPTSWKNTKTGEQHSDESLVDYESHKLQSDAAKSNHEKYLEVKERLAERNAMDERKEKISKRVNKDNITSVKTHKELIDKLDKNGLKLDSADAHTMENSNSLNGEKVTMYDKDGNEYRGTYNKYSDGGREIVDIKKTGESPRKIARDNETLKEKQIKQNEAERDRLNGKATNNNLRYYTESQLNDETFRKEALDEMKRYERNWSYYSKKEKQNISPNGVKELRNRIKEIENYDKAHRRGNK